MVVSIQWGRVSVLSYLLCIAKTLISERLLQVLVLLCAYWSLLEKSFLDFSLFCFMGLHFSDSVVPIIPNLRSRPLHTLLSDPVHTPSPLRAHKFLLGSFIISWLLRRKRTVLMLNFLSDRHLSHLSAYPKTSSKTRALLKHKNPAPGSNIAVVCKEFSR